LESSPLPWDKPERETTTASAESAEQPTTPSTEAPAVTEPAEPQATLPPEPESLPQTEVPAEPEPEPEPEPVEELPPPIAWTEEQVNEARAQCHEQLAGLSITYIEVATIGVSNGCGIAAPVEVTFIGSADPVEISPPATLNCTLVAALARWVDDTLQPAAYSEFDEAVSRIRNASSYVCRRRNGRPDGKLSEHALGNALDVAAFIWQDESTVTVEDGWPSVLGELLPGAEAKFLKAVHAGACETFSTVLGPDANAAHADHFHFDLGRGGQYQICE
jgi:hypothetical protein